MGYQHTPVLFREALEALNVGVNKKYIDGTIGGGGHTNLILGLGGKVIGIDQDEDAHLHLEKKFESEIEQGRLVLVRGNFADIVKHAKEHDLEGASNASNWVDGILLDLGLSSYQIDESGRGFSFKGTEPLDMRMDKTLAITAADIVNTWGEDELYEIFAKYGEEPMARKYAQRIVDARRNNTLTTTADLVSILVGDRDMNTFGGIHPATRVFQALRIVVNDEINSLKTVLRDGFKLLAPSGRMVVISFHSLEDRAVKLTFLELQKSGSARIITKKPIIASDDEIARNRRARSAKMRVIEAVKS